MKHYKFPFRFYIESIAYVKFLLLHTQSLNEYGFFQFVYYNYDVVFKSHLTIKHEFVDLQPDSYFLDWLEEFVRVFSSDVNYGNYCEILYLPPIEQLELCLRVLKSVCHE